MKTRHFEPFHIFYKGLGETHIPLYRVPVTQKAVIILSRLF